ncbi:MAG: nuclear transport factor 2 family protein [Pyrinomonadaceae bacterium]
MRSKSVLTLAVGLLCAALSGCGGPPANPVGGNANAAKANTNNPLETTKSTPEELKNNAPTLTPVFKAYCEAWKKNDEAALRKVYSQDTIKFFESQMKLEKIKTLIKYLEGDKVAGEPCEVINEKIDGDKAVARIRTDKYPNGIQVVFVKEEGEWRMTNKSPALDLKQSANSAQ